MESPTMASSSNPKASRDKVRAHRARLRAQGLRPIQIWVPDVRSPEFLAEAHRQSLIAANSPSAAEDQAFIDSVSAWSPDQKDD
jgi:Protein  of unknown function (DUF3018)